LFSRSVSLFKGAATPPPFRRPRGVAVARSSPDMHLGVTPATRCYVHLPDLAASLGPHPPGWMARNATVLLLSRGDRYSLARPASLGLVHRITFRVFLEPSPYACTRAFAYAISYSCTTLAVVSCLVGSGCREAISDFTYPSFPHRVAPVNSAGVGYFPCEGRRLPPDLV
jgi:hypothetical protein